MKQLFCLFFREGITVEKNLDIWYNFMVRRDYNMKKIYSYVLLLLSFLILVSCNTENSNSNQNNQSNNIVEKIQIYTVNDFHGAIKDKASRVANYLITNKTNNPNTTIILSAGDMFQGTGISNLNHGLNVVDIMNMIEFDAMSVGNHEFDWNLNTVLQYFDGNKANGEANFPLLSCNIQRKDTKSLPEHVAPYHIIERGGLKIAIVGYMGMGLESDIATSMIENYEFLEPVQIIKELVYQLRTEEKVDVVIANGHDASSNVNRQLSNLSGDYRIDAIVNGHMHARSVGTNQRSSDGIAVPYVQAGSSGEYVGVIELNINKETKQVTGGTASTKTILNTSKENPEVKAYVDELVASTANIFERVIGVAGKKINQPEGAKWASNAMLSYCKEKYGVCDIAFVNTGGIRNSAFPIEINEAITVNKVYEIMPFDNTVKMVNIKGKVLKNLILLGGELVYSNASVTVEGNSVYCDGNLIQDDMEYRVAVVDYIFDKETYPFLDGTNIFATGELLRDILITDIENCTLNDQKWYA